MKKNIHVVYDDGQWKMKRENSQKATKVFDTKISAVDYSRNIAKNDKVEFAIHNKDGRICNKNSYGSDPCPPKDKKC